jgi:hypothetical protein
MRTIENQEDEPEESEDPGFVEQGSRVSDVTSSELADRGAQP